MALFYQVGITPNHNDIPVFNYSGADIPANTPLKLDTANLLGAGGNSGIGVLPSTANHAICFAFARGTIKAGQSGKAIGFGPIMEGVCDGAVTANTWVDASATANRSILTHTAGNPSVGLALATGADNDHIPFMMMAGPNA